MFVGVRVVVRRPVVVEAGWRGPLEGGGVPTEGAGKSPGQDKTTRLRVRRVSQSECLTGREREGGRSVVSC